MPGCCGRRRAIGNRIVKPGVYLGVHGPDERKPYFYDGHVIEAVLRASRRAAAVARLDLKRGLTSLATITSVAPFVGVAGNALGIVNSFTGCNGERSAIMAAIAAGLSDSFAPTALGLAVALLSLWAYRYLSGVVETLDREMDGAALDLANALSLIARRRCAQ